MISKWREENMTTRKKLETDLVAFDQAIQSLQYKVDQLAAFIRSSQNQQMQGLIDNSAAVENNVTSTARDRLADDILQAQNIISDANRTAGLDVLPFTAPNAWATLQPPTNRIPPEFVRIGELTGVLQNAAYPAPPALLPLVKSNHVLVFHPRQLLAESAAIISSIGWRISLSTSPKNYRFTLIDSIDSGKNFASFLTLPESIRGEKIVCKDKEIEATLQTVVEDMENVIQQRLRENYDTVEDYNAANPHTAVPYHFILFTALPNGFNDHALDLLTTIAHSGIKAGIYLVGTIKTGELDNTGDLLYNLMEHAACISMTQPGFAIWDDPNFAHMLIKLDTAPRKALLDRISGSTVAAIGEISDVVGISRFLPVNSTWMKSSSESGLSAPLGVDQNGKSFAIQLGPSSDTFHALVGGRINSGKSNFLHALILSLCTTYSADELNLYLVDFKEGIEFQDYALHKLPHARAIVIEAEREFGLSILQFLYDEIERRGEEFKKIGTNVVNFEDYRSKTQEPMPRIVAVMDEFVLLFEEDDAIGDQAYQLLLNIAQRSRAFGIHLVLSTHRPTPRFQTLAPVKSQIGLRVGFKCTDNDDSALILGEGNEKAASLDAKGMAYITYEPTMPNRSSLVKIGYVDPPVRKKQLEAINRHYQVNGLIRKWNPIVFSRQEPAYWNDCSAIKANFENMVAYSEPIVWLGPPVRLAEDQSITFLEEENDNLLLLGSDETLAFQAMVHAMTSIALTTRPDMAEFFWLSAQNRFPGASEYLEEFRQLARHPLEICPRDSINSTLSEMVGRMERRKIQETDRARLFLLIPGIHRISEFRDNNAESPTSAELLERLLQEGPQVGIHVITWVDRFETLRNTLSYSDLDLFNHRIAFHMSVDDSNAFLGVSTASKLGIDKRLLYRNQRWAERTVDKVKPYSLPAIGDFRRLVTNVNQRWE